MEHRCLSPWKGAVVGGLIAFAWSAVSWMALPFHDKTISRFTDPAAVVNALSANAPQSGIYVLANDPKGQSAPTDPFLFVSYERNGGGSTGQMMVLGLLLQMIGAFFWTWILGKIPGLTLKDSALYGCFFGLGIGALGAMPNWVWWKFSLPFTAMHVVDAVVAWTLASMALSRCYAAACALPKKS